MTHPLEDLSWMVGVWSSDEGDSSLDESWLHPRAGLMLGVRREVRGSELLLYEFLRIEESGEGLTYWSHLLDRAPLQFALRSSESEHVEFQRPFPDFPSVISYRKDGDHLCTRTEGILRGRQHAIERRCCLLTAPER